jgi:hypothetical protein
MCDVLGERSRLSAEDYRGLTPLIYTHINPYGRFDIDLDQQSDVDRQAA